MITRYARHWCSLSLLGAGRFRQGCVLHIRETQLQGYCFMHASIIVTGCDCLIATHRGTQVGVSAAAMRIADGMAAAAQFRPCRVWGSSPSLPLRAMRCRRGRVPSKHRVSQPASMRAPQRHPAAARQQQSPAPAAASAVTHMAWLPRHPRRCWRCRGRCSSSRRAARSR